MKNAIYAPMNIKIEIGDFFLSHDIRSVEFSNKMIIRKRLCCNDFTSIDKSQHKTQSIVDMSQDKKKPRRLTVMGTRSDFCRCIECVCLLTISISNSTLRKRYHYDLYHCHVERRRAEIIKKISSAQLWQEGKIHTMNFFIWTSKEKMLLVAQKFPA